MRELAQRFAGHMEIPPGRVIGYTLPAIVVADEDEAIVLFQPTGTVVKRRAGVRGGPRGPQLLAWGGGHEDVV